MIPREELRRWSLDRDAQAATLERIEDASRRMKALPFLQRLRQSMERLSERSGPAIMDAAAEALDDAPALQESFGCLVEAAAHDPFFRPALRSIHSDINSGILLFDSAELNVVLSILPVDALASKRTGAAGPASIVFTGQLSLYKFFRSGGATFSFWEAAPIESSFTAAGTGPCRLAGRRTIGEGELLRLDGRREGFVIEHAAGDLVYLHASTSVDCAPLTVEYDVESLAFVGASSTDEVSSRTQMMLALLRTMERSDALPVFIDMLNNRHFYARWQAMRELLGLDAEAALPHLRSMAEADPHPEVRAAAGATLAACFPAEHSPGRSVRQLEFN
jgi:hypothetical protein